MARSKVAGAQHNVTVSNTALTLTVPDAAGASETFIEDAQVRYTRDGTAPTTTLGQIAYPGDIILCDSHDEATELRVIRGTATDGEHSTEYFTEPPS